MSKKLKIPYIDKFTNQNLLLKIKRIKFSVTLKYKRFTQFKPED